MNLEIDLVGFQTEWRFSGSEALTGWLKRRPWSRHVAPLSVRLSNVAQGDALMDAVRRGALGWADGAEDALDLIEVRPLYWAEEGLEQAPSV